MDDQIIDNFIANLEKEIENLKTLRKPNYFVKNQALPDPQFHIIGEELRAVEQEIRDVVKALEKAPLPDKQHELHQQKRELEQKLNKIKQKDQDIYKQVLWTSYR